MFNSPKGFPKNERALRVAGYKYRNHSLCSWPECQREIEWWETPNGERMPLDTQTKQPHWATCPGTPHFRKSRPKKESQQNEAV